MATLAILQAHFTPRRLNHHIMYFFSACRVDNFSSPPTNPHSIYSILEHSYCGFDGHWANCTTSTCSDGQSRSYIPQIPTDNGTAVDVWINWQFNRGGIKISR